MKCSICNSEHANEVDQFASHISAYGETEAWQMWREFAFKLLQRAESAEAKLRQALEEAAKVAKEEGERYSRQAGNVYARHSGRAAANRIVHAIRALAAGKDNLKEVK